LSGSLAALTAPDIKTKPMSQDGQNLQWRDADSAPPDSTEKADQKTGDENAKHDDIALLTSQRDRHKFTSG
jgi:hypothetical protein